MYIKKVLYCIMFCLLFVISNVCMVQAAESEPESEIKAQEPDYDDPDYVKHLYLEDQVTYSRSGDFLSPFTGQFYEHAEKFADKRIIFGIDVSKWQGTIDWKKVKASGVEFAFIRCGYTAVNNPFRMGADPYFEQNIKNAYAAGLKIGVYYFSNATSLKEVKAELNKTLNLIKPYKHMISLPVVYDYEAFTDAYRAYGTSRKTVTANAKYFLDGVKSAGYEAMYYGCPEVLNHTFDVSKLSNYKCWLANYTSKTGYDKNYSFWQYSESGRVDGIHTPVDCDFYYDTGEYGFTGYDLSYSEEISRFWMKSNTKFCIKLGWNRADCDGYKLYRSKAYDGEYKKIKTIVGSDVLSYKDTGVKSSDGREYYYRIVPYKKSGGRVLYGKPSGVLRAMTKKVYKTKVKAVTDLSIREKAGTGYNRIGIFQNKKSTKVLGYTLDKHGSKWYKIKYNGVTGYVSGAYVKVLRYGRLKSDAVGYRTLSLKNKGKLRAGTDVLVIKTKKKAGRTWAYVRYGQAGAYQYRWVLQSKIKWV